MTKFILIALALSPRLLAAQGYEDRYYWPVSVVKLASGTNKHTHVQVTGQVVYAKKEMDGDTHIKLAANGKFIIAECIPALRCEEPATGAIITVFGISRFDGEHKWYEVHPVEYIKIGK